MRVVADDVRHRGKSPQVELRRRGLAAVAAEAVAGKKRADGLSELAFESRVGGLGGRRRKTRKEKTHYDDPRRNGREPASSAPAVSNHFIFCF